MSDQMPPEGVVSAASDKDGILIVRVFDAPRELVFKAWTEPERFATWFGEHGSSIPLENISMDARPGGAWSVPGNGIARASRSTAGASIVAASWRISAPSRESR